MYNCPHKLWNTNTTLIFQVQSVAWNSLENSFPSWTRDWVLDHSSSKTQPVTAKHLQVFHLSFSLNSQSPAAGSRNCCFWAEKASCRLICFAWPVSCGEQGLQEAAAVPGGSLIWLTQQSKDMGLILIILGTFTGLAARSTLSVLTNYPSNYLCGRGTTFILWVGKLRCKAWLGH